MDVEAYLARHEQKELLRFVAVGSVDDGKSTLIGRLLHDTHGIYEDQLAAVERASKTRGSTGGKLDLSLLTDGLKAEREQGITIDVAYRYFSTDQRKFIIADTPGHIQYTRNMATGASTANVALILIDARHGVLQQSRRHAYIASLLGIPHLFVCVNKMDLVGFDEKIYRAIEADFRAVASTLHFQDVRFLPISAVDGDNVAHRSDRMPWYHGGTVLQALETVPIGQNRNRELFRFPVQLVLRPDLRYRGFCGTLASGVVRAGDSVMVLPSRKRSRVASIDTYDGALEEAYAPMSVTVRLTDEIDLSRGEMIVHPDHPTTEARRFEANVVWLSETPLDPARSYMIKHTTRMVRANVEAVLGRVDLDSLAEQSAERLELNDIGRLALATNQPLFFDPYTQNRQVGAFVLIDALSNNTVGAGMIIGASAIDDSPESRIGTRRLSQVDTAARRTKLGHGGVTLCFAGESAPWQPALAYALERALFDRGLHTTVLDVDGIADVTRSPALFADLAMECTRAGLVTIFSSALPRAAERDELDRQLDERLILIDASEATTPAELALHVLDLLSDRGVVR